jgi:hypothetical protein
VVFGLLLAYSTVQRERRLAEFQREFIDRRNEMQAKAIEEEKQQQEIFEKQKQAFWDTVDKGHHPGLLPRE